MTEDRAAEPTLARVADAGDIAFADELVRSAGALAAELRSGALQIDTKGHISDLVTVADRSAEHHVADAVARARPADGIFGEEGTGRAGTSGRTWVVDPVDGTYNFVAGIPNWCCAIALRDDTTGESLLGAVHQPATGDTWLGGIGVPTTWNGRPVPPIVDRGIGEVSVATYLHPPTSREPDRLEPWLAVIRAAATIRVLGSGSVDLAWVASGRLGAFAQPDCPEWDWLPGSALVRAAGGVAIEVAHRGHRWCLAGPPTAIAELAEALVDS